MDGEFAILGAGSAAAVFACELAAAGAKTRVWARRPEAAERLASRCGESCRAQSELEAALDGADVAFFCVSDGALRELAERVAKAPKVPGVALHLSGFHDAAILEPIAERGVHCGSLHPVRPLARGAPAAGSLRGTFLAYEGSTEARSQAAAFAQAAGAVLFDLPAGSGGKRAYHAAAALLSNGTVALFDAALELTGRNEDIAQAFLSLLSGTTENLKSLGVPDALTGPALRGDEEVLLGHLEQLDSEQRALYGSLTKRMLQLALQRDALTTEQVQRLRELL